MTEQTSTGRRHTMLRGCLMAGLLFTAVVDFHNHQLKSVLAEAADEEYDTVSGTLDRIDVAEKKGAITTDLGKHVSFQIPKPELFLNLSPGQRVTLKLDKQGRAVRVMDNAAPELPPPPSGPR